MEYVTAVPTNAKPAKNGHIFLPSRAAVRKNDSDAYGIVLLLFVVSVCLLCDTLCASSWGKKQVTKGGDRRETSCFAAGVKLSKSSKFFFGKKNSHRITTQNTLTQKKVVTKKRCSFHSRTHHTRIDRSIGLIF